MSRLSRLSHLGFTLETVMGTVAAPTFYVPWTAADLGDDIAPMRDESIRANDSVLQGQYGGTQTSTASFSCKAYPTLLGHLLRAIGMTDAIGVVAAGLYPHVFKSNGAAQPPTYTLTEFQPGNNAQARSYPGMMLSELTIKADAKAEVTVDTKWEGWPSSLVTIPTPTYLVEEPFLGWELLWSANAVSSTRVLTSDLMLKRSVDLISSSDGTQGPRETFGGGIESAIKGSALFEDESDLLRYLNYAQQAAVMSLVKPIARGGESVAVTVTKASWMKARRNSGSNYEMLDFEIDGVYSATDAGPAQITLNNTKATAY